MKTVAFILFVASFVLLILPSAALAQVIAPSAQELEYSYSAEFLAEGELEDAEDIAVDHASHMFGIFSSPTILANFNLDYDLVGGIAAPRSAMRISIVAKLRDKASGLIRISYTNKGKLIAHKQVASALLKNGALVLPLPANLTTIYNKKCTDSHYDSEGDYWYFYDPFRRGCEYLSQHPHANQVTLKVKPTRQVNPNLTPRLDLVRGNNGNGELFSIYVVHGFAESQKDREDDGRLNFLDFNDYLLAQGFTQKIVNRAHTRPLHLFTKSIRLANGKTLQVEIKHLLVETGIESRGLTFAKFFKEAVENADVVIYGGHSGLGGNLDIPSLEEKAGRFKFNAGKKQIFFFDSCSSYSYYLEPFAAEKTKAKIDIVTNGLSSYFHTSQAILGNFMDVLLDPNIADATWMDILQYMEEPLEGGTYLLNVGGL